MGYVVEMECQQTQVGDHNEIGYVSGDRLPVGHPDAAGPNWRPVVREEPDEPPPPKAASKESGAQTAPKTGGVK